MAERMGGKELARALANFVNVLNNREETAAFVEELTQQTHRTLQQGVMRLFVQCIEAWAAAKSSDARNAGTVQLCKRIVEATGDQYERHLPLV